MSPVRTLIFVIAIAATYHLGYGQLSGYSLRKKITIDNGLVSGTKDLSNFPFLFSATDSDLRSESNGGYVTQVQGYDITFTADDEETILDHQIDHYDPSTGEFIAWIRIPILDTDDNTILYMYVGDASITSDPSTTNTWNSSFLGVWHLTEDPSGLAPQILDGTLGGNNGTANGTMTSGDLVTGKIGRGIDFDGNDDYLEIGDVLIDGLTALTVEAWINPRSVGSSRNPTGHNNNEGAIVHKAGRGDDNMGLTVATGGLSFYLDDGANNTAQTTVPTTNTWTHVVGTWDGTTMTIYKNGIASGTLGNVTSPLINNTNALRIGGGHTVNFEFDGIIDEVRISNTARNQDWITTQYNNQNDPSSFFSLTTTQAPGNVFGNLRLWLKSDQGLKNGGVKVSLGAVDEWEASNSNVSFPEILVNTGSPTMVRGFMNYHPSVYFDGVDDKFEKENFDADVLFSDQDNTFFYVVRRFALNDIDVLCGWQSDASGDRAAYFESNSEGTLRSDLFAGTPRVMNATTNTVETDIIARVYSDNTGRSLALDGVVESTLSAGSMTASGNQGDFSIGSNPTTLYAENYTSELIIYNTALSADEIDKVESYLALKYAITLGGADGDYTASDGTTFWDASVSPTYHNEVIGIGRDDLSGLLQKQSHPQEDSLRIFVDNLFRDNPSNTGSINNDVSFITIGHDGGLLKSLGSYERPIGDISRFDREWKVTNTNYTDEFGLEFEWEDDGSVDLTKIRLFVDDDGDFSNTKILGPSDGLTFTTDPLRVEGISSSHIPINSVRYITLASLNSDPPLPVELLYFTADFESQQGAVQLQWATAAEIDNQRFEIERSPEGTTWRTIVTLDGAGNSTQTLSYQATDKNPLPGISYYRLKQIDFDGSFSYSDTRAVTVELASSEAKVYPNPAGGYVIIEGVAIDKQAFQIFNISGRDISKQVALSSLSSDAVYELDISLLLPGLYYIRAGGHHLPFIKKLP